MTCWPSLCGKCSNLWTDVIVTGDIGNRLSALPAATTESSLPSRSGDDNQFDDANQPVNGERGREGGVDATFLKEKFAHAFGAQLLNCAGDDDASYARSLWWGTVSL